jgi:PPOX class probable F420-dependent enzyme
LFRATIRCEGDDVTASFAAMSAERFVSLTTFRRTGAAVSTPVWITPDGDALLVTTPVGSGKVKRVRNNAQVTMRPCSRGGQVANGAPTITARAEIVTDPSRVRVMTDRVRAKYGLEYKIFMVVERLVARRAADRLFLRLTPSA